jgi:hypothetical protein
MIASSMAFGEACAGSAAIIGGAAQDVEQSDVQVASSEAVARPPTKPAATRNAVPIGRASLLARRVERGGWMAGESSSRLCGGVPELFATSLGGAGAGIARAILQGPSLR